MIALAGSPVRIRLPAMLIGQAAVTAGVTAWLVLNGDAGLADGARALAAGVALAGLFEIFIRLARWAGGGRWLASALSAGLLVLPGAITAYERLALDLADTVARTDRPDLMVLSGLPLLWSEGGVGAMLGGDAPPAAVAELGRAYTLRPLTAPSPDVPIRGRLLLIAQPRIDAAGLVAIDGWVRGGGRVLILIDPDLRWPSRLPPGDPARPPDATPLVPLMAHWGITLENDRASSLGTRMIQRNGADFRVRLGAPGRLAAGGRACRVSAGGLIADCAIGAGQATIVADGDWLIDDLWVGVGSHGASRYRRTADNGVALVTLVDDLAGATHRRMADPVLWMKSTPGARLGLIWAFAPCLLLVAAGLLMRRRAIHATLVTKS